MRKDDVMEQYRREIHSIVLAKDEAEIDEHSANAEEIISGGQRLLTPKEYADSLQALRVFTWRAKWKFREGI